MTSPIEPHPDSVLIGPDGRTVSLKVHRCLWSGGHPSNSLAALEECLRAPVARAEIDVGMFADRDFLVTHDDVLDYDTTGQGSVAGATLAQTRDLCFRWRGAVTDHRPPLLTEVVELFQQIPAPTVVELDIKDFEPWPWPRVEELVRIVDPIRDRIVFGGQADWNLRRLLHVDSTLPVGFNPFYYLDWVTDDRDMEIVPGVRGAYGYLDRHVLARRRLSSATDYLRDRLGGLLRLVPGAREAHLRLDFFERMLADGLTDVVPIFHAAGYLVDVWTLDAGTPDWETRLARAVGAGVDLVTTNTPHALSASGMDDKP